MESEEIKTTIYGLQFLKEKLYNGIFWDRLDCIDYAINALKEVQQYRAIGTVEEYQEAREKQISKECIVDSCSDHTHQVSEIKLKPCPFCGGAATFKRDRIAGIYCVKCTNCRCMTTFQFDFGEGEEVSKKKAADVWNRRDGNE